MKTDVIHEIRRISLNNDHRFYFIARYIINNIEDIPQMTIKELSKLTFSSISTINRFTKYLELSGYKELIHVIKYFSYTLIKNNEETEENLNDNIIYQTYKNVLLSIEETYNLFLSQEKIIDEIICELQKAKKIIIFAVGGTYNLARDFREKLLRISFNSIVVNNIHDGYFLVKQSNQDILNIFISYSGETKDLIKLALLCKEKESPVVVISKRTNNTLSRSANFKLVVTSNESIMRTVSITSRLALMFFLDMIFYKILLTNFNHYQKILKETSLSKF